MALSGSFTGTTANQYITPKIVWSATQDKANNKSTITAKLYYTKSSASTANTGGTWSGTISIGGYSNSFSGVSVVLKADNNPVLVATFSKTLDHNPDGTKSLTISATGAISGTTLSSTAISSGVTLDTIHRISGISCTDATIGTKPTITISRASSSFTHTVTYEFGTLTGTIAEKTSATSITSWTIPDSFYGQIPNDKKGMGAVNCTTYSGSTKVGTSTFTFWVYADESKCKPTVTGAVVDTNQTTIALTGNANTTLVRFFSTASCTMSVTLNKSAGSITAKTINNVSVSGTTRTISNVETGTFDFYAKDSRGYYGEDKEVKTLIPYIKLTNDATAKRTDPTSGNATLTIGGAYYKGSFGATSNTLTVKYRQGTSGNYTTITPTISDNKYSATVSLTGLDYTKSFTYEVVVSDKLMTISKTITLQKGIPVFDWGEGDFRFNVPVVLESNINGAYIHPARVWFGNDTFRMQSKYSAWDNVGDTRQTFFVFGSANGVPIYGVARINSNGLCGWSGSTGVSVVTETGGVVAVTLPNGCYDDFIIISTGKFSIKS